MSPINGDTATCTEAEHGAHFACPHVWEWLREKGLELEDADLLATMSTGVAQAVASHVRTFAVSILHGAEDHRAWLTQAAEDYCREHLGQRRD